MVTVSIFGVVVIIFILHPVLTHLINWWFREADDELTFFATTMFMIVELSSTLILFDYYIN